MKRKAYRIQLHDVQGSRQLIKQVKNQLNLSIVMEDENINDSIILKLNAEAEIIITLITLCF